MHIANENNKRLSAVGVKSSRSFVSQLVLVAAVLLSTLVPLSANAQSVSVSPNAVLEGESVVASWSGFGGNVNIEVWRGGSFWVYAATDVSGSGNQTLNTTSWQIRSDYRVKVVLRSNTNIYSYSNYFSVSDPSVSVSPDAVLEGDDTQASWSGFGGNVNIEVWRGGSFWTYAATDVPGSGNQTLNTTGWQVRSDYRVKVVLRDNTSIYAYSNYFSVNDPSVSVYPTSVIQGQDTEASWSGFSSNVNVEVWRGGSFWLYASTNVAGTGNQTLNTTDWQIRSDYRIKVVLRADTDIYEYSNFFAVTTPPTITVTFPTDGATLYMGHDYTVTWTSQNVSGNVQIDLHKDGQFVVQLAASAPNDGSYPFNPPFYLESGDGYQISVSAMEGTVWDFSDGDFSILTPTLDLTCPDGGEVWDIGGTYTITWQSQQVLGDIHIQPYIAGQPQDPIATNAPNTGSYAWQIPADYPTSTQYEIGISAMGGEVYSFSESTFTIRNPGIPGVGFDFPVGYPDGDGWHDGSNCVAVDCQDNSCLDGLAFLEPHDYGGSVGCIFHPGNDWNMYGTQGDEDAGQPIHAISDGQVVAIPETCSWGALMIRHDDVPGYGTLWSVYGHMHTSTVSIDEWVTRGDVVGVVGDKGTIDAHLHFEIRYVSFPACDFPLESEGEGTIEYVLSRYLDPVEFINENRPGTPVVSVSPYSVMVGEDVEASWSGFSGNINLEVWKGVDFWLYANTDVPGTGTQILNTTDWEWRADYRVRAVLRSNPDVFYYSNYFTVNDPLVGVYPTSVVQGGDVTATWTGFSGYVNLEVWRGDSFWLYANTDIPGSGDQVLNTTEWQLRSDYRVKVVLRADEDVFGFSNYFEVTSVLEAPEIYLTYNGYQLLLQWTPVEGANSYNVYSFEQDEEPVLLGSTTSTEYDLTSVLEPDPDPYQVLYFYVTSRTD